MPTVRPATACCDLDDARQANDVKGGWLSCDALPKTQTGKIQRFRLRDA